MTAVSAQTATMPKRDYSLVGESSLWAVETGLASAEWYHSEIPRKTMKELMQRTDGPAIRDTVIWFAAIIGSAAGAIYFWGSWWCVPFFLVYGVLYGSSSDSRWHECGHGTAFKTRWMNDVVYEIASFMQMRNPVAWRWSHARHHTDTIIVGRDAEIAIMRPPDLLRAALSFLGLLDFRYSLPALFRQAFAGLDAEEKSYIPEMERQRAVKAARWHVAIYVVTVAHCPLQLVVPAVDVDWPAAALRHLAHGAHRPAAAYRAGRQCASTIG